MNKLKNACSVILKNDDIEIKQHATKNQWINNEIKEEIKKKIEIHNNENITIQNLWDATKAALRGKFTVIQTFLKKTRKMSI